MELLHGEIPSIVNLTECSSVRNSIIKRDTNRQTCAILQMLSHLNTLLIPIPPRTDGQLKQKQNSKIVYSFQINYSYSVFQKRIVINFLLRQGSVDKTHYKTLRKNIRLDKNTIII